MKLPDPNAPYPLLLPEKISSRPPLPPKPKPQSQLAIAVLILGIMGILPYFGQLSSITGLVTGIVCLITIKQNGQTGIGKAIAGIVLSVFFLVVPVGFYAKMEVINSVSQTNDYAEVIHEETEEINVPPDADVRSVQLYKDSLRLEHLSLKLQAFSKKNGFYPEDVEGFYGGLIPETDYRFKNRIHYRSFGDDFTLRGLGRDNRFGTDDDVVMR